MIVVLHTRHGIDKINRRESDLTKNQHPHLICIPNLGNLYSGSSSLALYPEHEVLLKLNLLR